MLKTGGSIVFGETFAEDGLKLLELPAEVSEALLEGDSVSIKGDPDDEAVLCTTRQTFVVRKVESSNTCLLLPSDSGTVSSTTSCTYELISTTPRLAKLRALLSEDLYQGGGSGGGGSGGEEEPTDDGEQRAKRRRREEGQGYTTAELVVLVQASAGELRQGLLDLDALEVDGRWRLVDPRYLGDLFDLLVSAMIEHSWPLSAVSATACVSALEGGEQFCPHAVRHCLRIHSQSASGTGAATLWDMDLRKLAVSKAKRLLEAQKNAKAIYTEEFLDTWAGSLPDGVPVSVDMLRGLVLAETPPAAAAATTGGDTMFYYPASSLDDDAKARFGQLFARRAKWRLEDLEPFVEALVTPQVKQSTLLLKHTRSSAAPDGNGRLYSKR